MDLPKILEKQNKTLLHIYKYHYLNTKQIQKLFKQRSSRNVQNWLKDLREKGYVDYREFDRNKFLANTRPAIYFLTKLARRKLKVNPKCSLEVLNRVYHEKGVSESLVNKHIFIANIFLNLRGQMKKEQKLHFSTQANFKKVDYFPKPIPDIYFGIKTETKTKRYFLFIIDPKMPWGKLDPRIREYINYASVNDWSKHSQDPLPSFLFICPSQKTKNHLNRIISNELPEKTFYLTTKGEIEHSGFKGDAWQKVN